MHPRTCLVAILLAFGLAGKTVALDRLTIDFDRDPRYLHYKLLKLETGDLGTYGQNITEIVQVFRARRSAADTAILLKAHNGDLARNHPAVLSFQDYTHHFVIDDDPGYFDICAVGQYEDAAAGRKAVVVAGTRRDSAFVWRDLPGTDRYDPVFLTSQVGYQGLKSDIGMRLLGVLDYDHDGRHELFCHVCLSRAGPRTLFCIELETLRLEWSLPLSLIPNGRCFYDCKDSLRPSVVLAAYGPKNGAADSNFTDRYGYLARIGSTGDLLYNKIVCRDYIGPVLLPLDTAHLRFALYHNLPLTEPGDTASHPPARDLLSLLDRSGQVLAQVPVEGIIGGMWLSHYGREQVALYVLMGGGRIRIYDLHLQLLAESNETDLNNYLGQLRIQGEPEPAFIFATSHTSIEILSHDLRSLATLEEKSNAFEPMEFDAAGNVEKFILVQGSRMHIGKIQARRWLESIPIAIWEYQTHILIGMTLLSVGLIITYLSHRRSLAALRRSEARYRLLAENATDVVWTADLSLNLIYMSPSVERVFGYTVPEMIRMGARGFLTAASYERATRLVSEYFERLRASPGDSVHVDRVEFEAYRKDGSTAWVEIAASLIMDGDGSAARIVGATRDITDRKLAEEALRKAEDKYRTLVEGAREAIFAVNASGTFEFLNAVAAQRLGGKPSDLIGKTMWDLFPKEIADRQAQSIRSVIESGVGMDAQTRTVLAGGPVWHRTSIQPLRNSSGEVVSTICIASDISELMSAKESLQSQSDFTRSILETANSMIVCLDQKARITVFNTECERVTGFTRQEAMGRRWPELVLPEYIRHPGLQNFAQWVREHPSDTYEGPIRTKSGEIRTILWSNSAILKDDSDELIAIAIGQDITDRKRTEKALETSEEKARIQFANLPVPTYTWRRSGTDFRLIDFNTAAVDMTNGRIREVHGIRLSEFYDGNPEIIADLNSCYEQRTSFCREMEYRFKLVPKTRLLLVTYSFIPADLVMVSTQDVTERRRAEAEKLRQVKDIAGGFAHEIRNALFPAKVAASRIRSNQDSGPAPDVVERYRKIIDNAIARAIDMTRLISQYTKMDSEYQPGDVHLGQVVQEALKANQIRLEEQKVQVHCEGPHDLVVIGNSQQLYQVINNLLLNSLDALTNRADPRILVTWMRDAAGVRLEVTDNGCGIPPENLDRVFSAFFTTKPDKGTGLGLALTKRIVEMYGGEASVESTPGSKTCFRLKLQSAEKGPGKDQP